MKSEDRYHRFVCWSDEDQCYIGYCPDLYFGGACHGDQEEATYADRCEIVRNEIAHRLARGETLPVPAVRATRDPDFRHRLRLFKECGRLAHMSPIDLIIPIR